MRTIEKYSIVAAALLLASCSRDKLPMRVEIPVAVACVKPEQLPVRPRPLAETPMPTAAPDALDLALAKVAEWVGYGTVAEPLLRNCSR